MNHANAHEVLGIPVNDWARFLKRHSDMATPEEIQHALQREIKRHVKKIAPDAAAELLRLLGQMAHNLESKLEAKSERYVETRKRHGGFVVVAPERSRESDCNLTPFFGRSLSVDHAAVAAGI